MHCPKSRIARLTLRFAVGAVLAGVFSAGQPASAAEAAPIEPTTTIALFDGFDLGPFYTWLADSGHDDPRQVFTVAANVDGAPAIHISGQGFGGLITRQAYANYRLVAEFRWGTSTWGKKTGEARDSGILLYCQREDGNSLRDFHGAWLRSVEFQISEGGTGDMLIVNGYDRGSPLSNGPRLVSTVGPGTRRWAPDGVSTEFSRGRIDWRYHDPGRRDVSGFRGCRDVEKPLGQWNRLEALCAGDHLTYFVNGIKVNEATHCTFHSGKLLVQSEGAEVYYRRIELRLLDGAIGQVKEAQLWRIFPTPSGAASR